MFHPNKTYILDGAMGTALQKQGVNTALPLWSAQPLFTHPETVRKIHRDYILAGADIITTNTFRTQRRALAKKNLAHTVVAMNTLAVTLAVQARTEANVNRPVLIAASCTTLEDCFRPDLVPDNATLASEHTEQVQILAATPIDFFLLETLNTIREAVALARAVSATGKQFAISFTVNDDGALLSGELLENAVRAVALYAPSAYCINCVSPTTATKGLRALRDCTDAPIGAYAQGDGAPDDDQGWKFLNNNNEERYLIHCREWKKMGASIIGGCCGTTPAYTKLYSTLRK